MKMTREEALAKMPLPRWYGLSNSEAYRGWLLDSLIELGLITVGKSDYSTEFDKVIEEEMKNNIWNAAIEAAAKAAKDCGNYNPYYRSCSTCEYWSESYRHISDIVKAMCEKKQNPNEPPSFINFTAGSDKCSLWKEIKE